MADEDVRVRNVRAKAETEKALLVEIDGEDRWIPKSQITDDSEVYERGGEGDLVITAWFAKKENIG